MKKGFTLIELLAVIVILAIIAVIAVPIVIDIIDKSKENAILRSAEMYMDAVELSIADRVMHHEAIPNKAYPIMSNGNICLEDYILENEKYICKDKDNNPDNNELEVEVKGEKPTSGQIVIKNGQIVKELTENETTTKLELVISGQTIIKNEDDEFEIEKNIETESAFCEIISGSVSTPGSEVVCGNEHFYILSSTTAEVIMGTKYNLNVGEKAYTADGTKIGIQNENALGMVAYDSTPAYGGVSFADSVYWDTSSINSNNLYVYDENKTSIGQYVKSYKNYMEEELGINIIEIKLPTKTQAYSLTSYNPTSYWTGELWDYSMPSSIAIAILPSGTSLGQLEPTAGSSPFGVRPVITISKDQVK